MMDGVSITVINDSTDVDSITVYSKTTTAFSVASVFDQANNISELPSPLREPLSARYKNSFAFETFRERVPQILSDLINSLYQNEKRIMEKYGSYAHFELRRIVWSLDILHNEVLENKPFKYFYDKSPDSLEWNSFIKGLVNREKNQWFSANWMHAECYLYRRIWMAFQRSELLKDYDYFSQKKICSTRNFVYLFRAVLNDIKDLTYCYSSFVSMLKLSLWANRCDLSITSAVPSETIWNSLNKQNRHLLVDQSEDVWQFLTTGVHSSVSPPMVDIILDNAGFELFADLLLGVYLIDSKLAIKVRYHVKAIPYYVSDVTANDFRWMLNFLLHHEIPEFSYLGRKLRYFMRQGFFVLFETCKFWTRPQGFKYMSKLAPCLFVQLSFSALAIFKGDLNYRKLLDDINYSPTTPFKECLGGFQPTSICALRCIKSDLYCGLPNCLVELLTVNNPSWMRTGDKAIIQLAVKQIP
ncbi:damage-control phosphatase ARMT1 [Drosophila hydei]|uniref:Sugar phosphate phosphatase n=1 Tax=Drosophila hydei TaxID=7224 RepID=A0A6J1LMT3_DROHY|nr:damage-control phosphatase ARMT1 [Drosophila hydei]